MLKLSDICKLKSGVLICATLYLDTITSIQTKI